MSCKAWAVAKRNSPWRQLGKPLLQIICAHSHSVLTHVRLYYRVTTEATTLLCCYEGQIKERAFVGAEPKENVTPEKKVVAEPSRWKINNRLAKKQKQGLDAGGRCLTGCKFGCDTTVSLALRTEVSALAQQTHLDAINKATLSPNP